MAKCDGGYFCYACREYVENITQSELYLRYVLGEVPKEKLLELPDGHIWCNANLAQYIVDDRFDKPFEVDEPALRKENRDPEWVRAEEERVTRGWRHLQGLPGSGIPMDLYPLDRFEEAMREEAAAELDPEEEAPAAEAPATDAGEDTDSSMWV